MTNFQRAQRAQVALDTYRVTDLYDIDGLDLSLGEDLFLEIAGDLLADLFHLADEYGASIDELVARGRMHHEAEVEEEVAS